MVNGVNTPWNQTDGTDEVLNLTTYGQDISFPATWPVNRLFFRTDEIKLYTNVGTLIAPIFAELFAGESKQVYPYSILKADYIPPTTVVATSEAELTPSFSDDYTTNSGWTQIGTLVTVDSGVADKVAWVAALSGTDRRVHKSLGLTLSNSKFLYNFEYEFTAITSSPDMEVVYLSDDTADPHPTNTSIGLGVQIQANGNFHLFYKASGANPVTSSSIFTPTISTTYYCTLRRTTTTSITLDVYDDSGRTNLVGTGSLTIPSNTDDLITLQHAGNSISASRSLTATIDTTRIYSDVSTLAEIKFVATNVLTDNITQSWQSNSESEPGIKGDMNAVKDGAAIMLNVDRDNTTVTTLQLEASSDLAFTTPILKRTVLVADLVDEDDEFYRFNRLDVDLQFYRITSPDNGVISLFKFFVQIPTNYTRRHQHKNISNTNTALNGEGSL